MQFYGTVDNNGYLTNISTNQQNGFNEYTIQDKYAPFLQQYYDKMRIINGIVSVPDNLPISQFEKDKAEWSAQIEKDKQDIQNQLDTANKTIEQLRGVTIKAQQASVQTGTQLSNMQKMLLKLQQSALINKPNPTSNNAQGSNSAAPNSTNVQTSNAAQSNVIKK